MIVFFFFEKRKETNLPLSPVRGILFCLVQYYTAEISELSFFSSVQRTALCLVFSSPFNCTDTYLFCSLFSTYLCMKCIDDEALVNNADTV